MDTRTAFNILRTYIGRRKGTAEDKNRGYYYTRLHGVLNTPLFSSIPYQETEGSIQVARQKVQDVLYQLEKSIDYKDTNVSIILNYTKSDSI